MKSDNMVRCVIRRGKKWGFTLYPYYLFIFCETYWIYYLFDLVVRVSKVIIKSLKDVKWSNFLFTLQKIMHMCHMANTFIIKNKDKT